MRARNILRMGKTGALRTTQEVAEEYGVHPSTVRRWVKAGHLAATRLPGGQLRFRPEDVDAIGTAAQPTEAAS